MAVFCRLSDPANYRPSDWDLLEDEAGREYWLDEFRDHARSMLAFAAARRDPPPADRLDAMRCAYEEALEALRRRPDARGRLDVLELCMLRDEFLQAYDIGDPYADVKQHENEAALRNYPDVTARLDSLPADRVVEALVRGVLAGNRFDLGSPATTSEYADGGIDFHAALSGLKPRPWFADDLDRVGAALGAATPYRKAIIFADNAGADAVLGILPLARHLAGVGIGVTVAATSHHALNDITRPELDAVLDHAGRQDPALANRIADGRITTVGTGHTQPLIDLADISDACNAAAADCDLVILEGMGRAVESNYRTPFRCDCIRLAMIKNRAVARHYGSAPFDLVCRFTPAARSG